MDRCWLLTWTTYGTWLPGDERGFVSNVRDGAGPEVCHNAPGTECDAKLRGLWLSARHRVVGDPVYLSHEHACELMIQFKETAQFRGWNLLAAAIMSNHVHLLVGVPGDPEPETLLRDFKSYASRRLSQKKGKPPSGTWWTEGGSKRKKANDGAVHEAVRYVVEQQFPPLVWRTETIKPLGERGA